MISSARRTRGVCEGEQRSERTVIESRPATETIVEAISFRTLAVYDRGPVLTREARLGALLSLIVHLAMVGVLLMTLPKLSLPEWEEPLSLQTAPPPGQIIELEGPLYAPPPEVIRQLTGGEATRPPRRPEFLSERSTIARGEPNPNPSGSSTLPKVSGPSRKIPELGPEQTSRLRSGSSSKETMTDSRLAPTLPPAGPRAEVMSRSREKLPDALLAVIGNASAPLEPFGNSQSGVTLEGLPAVNAQAVAAMEEYRAYVERAIQRQWFIPPEANLLQAPVAVIIEFEIARDGRLLQLRLRQSSRIPALDRAAMNAVRLASPFRPLPSVYPFESQWFTDKFIYYPPR